MTNHGWTAISSPSSVRVSVYSKRNIALRSGSVFAIKSSGLSINAKRDYYRTRVQRHKRANPAEWYKQIKIMTNCNKGESIPFNLLDPPQVDPNDLKAVADCINHRFVSVSKDLKPLDTSDRPHPNPWPVVQEFEVWEMLLKTKKWSWWQIIWRRCMSTAMEESRLSANPKSKPACWDKLRPLSLTDNFAKVAEGFMAKWLLQDMEAAVDPNQFGNQNGVSTTHYLIKLVCTLHMNANKHAHLPSW